MFRNRLPFSIYIPAILALLVGLGVTAVVVSGLRQLEQDKLMLDFRQRAAVRIAALTRGVNDAVQVAKIINQYVVSSGAISRAQFQQFSQPLLQHYPYIQAFNIHLQLAGPDRPAYEAMMRQQFPGFEIRELVGGTSQPASRREAYNVVDFIEPMQGNEPAFGLDVFRNVQVAGALDRALETGQAAATQMVRLAQAPRGFLVLVPLYRPGMPVDTPAQRRQALLGDTAVVLKADGLMEKILGGNGLLAMPGFDTSVYATDHVDPAQLAFSRAGPTPVPSRLNALRWLPRDDTFIEQAQLDVAGVKWTVVVRSRAGWSSVPDTGSTLALVVGLFFSLAAAAYIQAQALRAGRIQQLVDQRTQQLSQANELLTKDIAARELAESALKLRQRAIEASANAILIINTNAAGFTIDYVNPAFERISGYSAADALGRAVNFLCNGDLAQGGLRELEAAAAEQREGHAILRTYRKDGTLFWSDIYMAPVRDEQGNVNHFVIAHYDITERKRHEAELEFRTNRDPLTGLANRNLLRDRLAQSLAFAMRHGHPVWVVFVDLDRFKFVNDTLGHLAGDELLKKVAERLQGAVRETDTVARLGGDEFVLLLPERSDVALSTIAVQRVMDAIARPVTIEGHEFFLTCSIGVSAFPADGDDVETLIKHADIAMYRAKETGRNNFQFYTAAMNQQALERLHLEGDLRTALERNEFLLHYQPQVDLRSGRIVGMEALLRWQHPRLGMVPPLRFIGLAEETGLIVPIGAWVLRTACEQVKAWQSQGLGYLRVSVNLSARQFNQHDLTQSIADVLQETGLEPQYLEIELTESMVMTDVDHTVGILRDLKALGVQMSIDDFGTGYSSLSYLKRFPIDVLKIDQSFVRDITLDPDDAAIVTTIISLAHNLRLNLIAEGVETEAQLQYLQRHGCDEIQGYYFSRPVPAEAFAELIREGKSLPVHAGDDRPLHNTAAVRLA